MQNEAAAVRLPNDDVKIVLDTNVFTNPEVARQWGADTAAAMMAFLKMARSVSRGVGFYMPPSIFAELKNFVGENFDFGEFEFVVKIQSPNRFSVSVPGFVLYELIEEIRERINKGLRVAEKAVREVRPELIASKITQLRDEYRHALRTGLIDSREDVDLILLAHELGAALVSSDHGVVKTADKMGVRLIEPGHLRGLLESLVVHDSSAQE